MTKLSTENLHLLPAPAKLKNICKSISALEAIISPEWEYRYYSYQKDWSDTEEFCEMRNGQGNHLMILFGENGTCINGFAHESKMNGWKSNAISEDKGLFGKLFGSKKAEFELSQVIPNGVVDQLPEIFKEFIFGEPVKSFGTTFCIWQSENDNDWKIGNVNLPNDDYQDGSSDLLQLLDGNPLTFKSWVEEYYEEDFEEHKLKLKLVEAIYNGTEITKELALEINPNLEDFEKLKTDLDEIGY